MKVLCVHSYWFAKSNLNDPAYSKPNSLLSLRFFYPHCPTGFQINFVSFFTQLDFQFFFLNVLHLFPIAAAAATQLLARNLGIKMGVGLCLLGHSVLWALTEQNVHAALRVISNGHLGTKVLTSCLPLLKPCISVSTQHWNYGGCCFLSLGRTVQSEGIYAITVTVPSRVLTPTI